MRVRVYRNLRWRKLSIQTKTEKGWRVFEHRDLVLLKDCVFHVNEKTRDRVRRTHTKEVHAWIEGELIDDDEIFYDLLTQAKLSCETKYNPYEDDWFNVQGHSVKYSEYASIDSNGYMEIVINDDLIKIFPYEVKRQVDDFWISNIPLLSKFDNVVREDSEFLEFNEIPYIIQKMPGLNYCIRLKTEEDMALVLMKT